MTSATAASTRRKSRGTSPATRQRRRTSAAKGLDEQRSEGSPARQQSARRIAPTPGISPSSAIVFALSAVLLVVVCSQAAIPTPNAAISTSNAANSSANHEQLHLTQQELIAAVQAERYDDVLRLAQQAKQLKEFEQVAEEVMSGMPRAELYGYTTVQVDAFFSSLMMILVSELGDKTFFIAAVLAMKHPRAIILAGALGALALMTILSSAAGFALPNLIPRVYTHYASVVLFVFFGIKLLKDAQEMQKDTPSEELEEVEAELSKKDKKREDPESAEAASASASNTVRRTLVNAVLWEAFVLTFLAEWGDRSQIATIALAAQKDPYGVTAGGILGHTFCTSLAVVGGRMLASRISERTVAISGGCLFLLFAVHGVWIGSSSLVNA